MKSCITLIFLGLFQLFLYNNYFMCIDRLRELVEKYQPSLLSSLEGYEEGPKGGDQDSLRAHLEGALQAVWSASTGSWGNLINILDLEIKKEVHQHVILLILSILYFIFS